MWAASPTTTAFETSSAGPLVSTEQPGFEHIPPARRKIVSTILLGKSSATPVPLVVSSLRRPERKLGPESATPYTGSHRRSPLVRVDEFGMDEVFGIPQLNRA